MIERHFYIAAQINEVMAKHEGVAKAVNEAIEQFNNNEWGKVPPEDKEANRADLRAREGRILGRYETPQGDIYIDMTFNGEEEEAVIMFVKEY